MGRSFGRVRSSAVESREHLRNGCSSRDYSGYVLIPTLLPVNLTELKIHCDSVDRISRPWGQQGRMSYCLLATVLKGNHSYGKEGERISLKSTSSHNGAAGARNSNDPPKYLHFDRPTTLDRLKYTRRSLRIYRVTHQVVPKFSIQDQYICYIGPE